MPTTDTVSKKKEQPVAVPSMEESIQSAKPETSKKASVNKAATRNLMDEPSAADSQTQNQSTYYYSNFQSNFTSAKNNTCQRSPSPQQQQNLEQSASFFNQNLPTSFEANFFTYRAGNYDQSNFQYLEQALSIQPNNTDAQLEYGLACIVQNETEKADSITQTLTNSGYFSAGIVMYSKDIIQSIPENSTLIVHGTSEMLPITKAKSDLKRTDLQIISLDLLQSEQYQMQLTGLGYQLPESKIIDTSYFKQFCQLNATKNLYLSMSFPKTYLTPIVNDLVVYGLSFGYKIEGIDAYNWNLNLYKFVWDTSTISQTQDLRSNTLSANYLPALMNLQKQFEWYKRTTDYDEITALINKIAQRSNKKQAVKSLGK